jgi:tetratricopeptide (TPR) repeat protein
MAYLFGLDFEDDGRSAAPVDIDGDGDLDLILQSLQGLRVMENKSAPARFARLRLRAGKGPILNAHVRLTAGGVTQQAFVTVTDGFQTQVPTDLHFGLGTAAVIDKVEVRWPSGELDSYSKIPVDKLVHLTKGAQKALTTALPRWPENARSEHTPVFSFPLIAENFKGQKQQFGKAGKPLLLNFRDPQCKRCQSEDAELEKLLQRFSKTAQIISVSSEATASAVPQMVLSDELKRSFFGASKRAPHHASFLFDSAGQLRRSFLRAISAEDVGAILKSLDSEPAFANDLGVRGLIALERKEYKDAIKWFRRAIKSDPKIGRFHNNLGFAYGALNMHDHAAYSFKDAVALERKNPNYWLNLGAALIHAKQPKAAIRFLESALDLRKRHLPTLLLLAQAGFESGQFGQALKAYNQALQVNPNLPKTYLARARCLEKLGQSKKAADDRRKAAELGSGS